MLIPDYQTLYDSMVIDPTKVKNIELAARNIRGFEPRYSTVSNRVNYLMPWYFVGLIHYMEAGQNFNKHLHNGDPLTARTIHVPIGRPAIGKPPFFWEDSAIDALAVVQRLHNPTVWTDAAVLKYLENYNGRGYQVHDISTPYLWSYTNHYTKGKFSSDGKFDPEAVSKQCGAAPILYKILNPS